MSTKPAVNAPLSEVREVRKHQALSPFGPGSIAWDDFGDVFFLATTLGAFMLQAMHPTISAAVDRHSVFRTDPFGRAVRSADSILLWIYGGQAAVEEGERLRVLHRPIHGVDEHGGHYSALDREAYAWVHATAFVTGVTTYPLIRGREMTADEQRRFYTEMLQLGEILQVPAAMMAASVEDYWEGYDTMVRERLARTPVAEELLSMISAPPLPLIGRVLGPLARPPRRLLGQPLYLMLGAGMTPDAREVLGLRWTSAHDASVRALFALARPIHDRLPERLRYLPLAAHARAHARELEAIRNRATKSVSATPLRAA